MSSLVDSLIKNMLEMMENVISNVVMIFVVLFRGCDEVTANQQTVGSYVWNYILDTARTLRVLSTSILYILMTSSVFVIMLYLHDIIAHTWRYYTIQGRRQVRKRGGAF